MIHATLENQPPKYDSQIPYRFFCKITRCANTPHLQDAEITSYMPLVYMKMLKLNTQLLIFEALKKMTSFSANQDKTCSLSDLNMTTTVLKHLLSYSDIAAHFYPANRKTAFCNSSQSTWIISP